MPVYEYECNTCRKVIEVKQKMSDEPLKTCPDCGEEVKKIMSVNSFHLKGGGWYADGYSSSGSSKPAACSSSSTGCSSCPASSS